MMLNQLIKDMYQLLGKELPEGMRPSQDVGRAVISLLVQAYMGLNPGSAIKNMTQKMLAVADVSTGTKPLRGFKYLTRAQAFKATRAGKEFCNKYCTLLKDRTYMEGLEKTARYEWKINRMLDATSKVTMAAFQAADTSNVTDSFLIGLFAALEDGKSMEEALWQANDVALRTQFPYDLRKPLLFHNPVMRIVGLFASWPIHLVELGVDWVGSSRWGKIILLAALMAGAKYLMRKLGIHLRISLLDSLEGHIAFKTATGERAAIVSYAADLSRAARKMASLDKDEWLKAMEELAYLSPGGTAYKRLMRFYRASQDNWRLRNKKGKVYYQYDRSGWLWDNIGIPEEAIRALIGETTESHDYWKDVYPTLTDKVEGKRDTVLKGVIGQ